MIAIVCVDKNNGMMFHNRRQSQDRVVRQNILLMVAGEKLWMNSYSYGQFQDEEGNFGIADDFLQKADRMEYCFVENESLEGVSVEKLVLYRWDKKYPSDLKLDIDLNQWDMDSSTEFEGYSHKKIVREVYEKHEK